MEYGKGFVKRGPMAENNSIMVYYYRSGATFVLISIDIL